jgi:alpha-amylase
MTSIVQMFNQPFKKVRSSLKRLQSMGFSHILVSPPQLSNSSRAWWGRYQPVDYRVIEGPLGNRWELEALCGEAAGRGLYVVADAVLNHMCNDRRYVRMHGSRVLEAHFPRFSVQDFRSGGPPMGRGRALPELRTDSEWVRNELRDYLHMLYGLGVRGFRFDAAKHIDPGFFPAVLSGLPPLLCFGELVHARASQYGESYWSSMRAYDFPLANAIKTAFAPGGDLRLLLDPARQDQALWGPLAVTFVNHHDLTKNPREFAYFRLTDVRDRQLAYVYLLGRADGVPLVYNGDLRFKEVKAGVPFYRRAEGHPQRWVHADPNVLAWTRGDRLLAAVNKAGHSWDAWHQPCGLAPGAYRDLIGGDRVQVDSTGILQAWLPGRTGWMLIAD